MSVVGTSSPPRPLPRLSLPLARRRLGLGAAVSLVVHGIILAAVVWAGAVAAQRGRGGVRALGGGGEGGGGRPAMNFFVLPAPAPAAMDVPAVPAGPLRALARIKIDVPALAALVAPSEAVPAGGTGLSQGAGGGAGPGPGTGTAPGTGTGAAGDYIFVASPRTAILPPLAKVPGSVSGRTYRIRFWVAADGRVTRVEIDPPIRDDAYRREFVERMLAYQFYPARTRDGANVASVVTVPLRIGN